MSIQHAGVSRWATADRKSSNIVRPLQFS